MMKNKNMDELFRDKLINYEKEPPAYILDNIIAGAASVNRKRKIIFWRVAGVAAALLLAFIAGWEFSGNNEPILKPETIVKLNSAAEVKLNSNSETGTAGQTATSEIAGETDDSHLTASSDLTSKSTLPESSIIEIQKHESDSESTEPDTFTESKLVAATSNKESYFMKPIKKLYGLIVQEPKSTDKLQDINSNGYSINVAEKTIDQQIMEQNKEMLLAQNESREKKRWLIGAQVSPQYNVSRSSHEKQYASNMLNSGSADNPVDLGGGVSVEYKKGKRWSLQSGVYYSGIGQTSGNSSQSNRNDYMSASPVHGSEYLNTSVSVDVSTSNLMMNSTAGVIEFSDVPSGIVLGTNLEDKSLVSAVVVSDARFLQNFEYIEIPLYLRYTVFDYKFDIELMGGFSSNFLVGNQTLMESSTGQSVVGKTKDMEAINYSGTLGLGFKYGLSKRIFLNVEPRIKYYLNSLNSNSSVTYKPYTIGVYSGLSYQF